MVGVRGWGRGRGRGRSTLPTEQGASRGTQSRIGTQSQDPAEPKADTTHCATQALPSIPVIEDNVAKSIKDCINVHALWPTNSYFP